jgi:hypothetical protein
MANDNEPKLAMTQGASSNDGPRRSVAVHDSYSPVRQCIADARKASRDPQPPAPLLSSVFKLHKRPVSGS